MRGPYKNGTHPHNTHGPRVHVVEVSGGYGQQAGDERPTLSRLDVGDSTAFGSAASPMLPMLPRSYVTRSTIDRGCAIAAAGQVTWPRRARHGPTAQFA